MALISIIFIIIMAAISRAAGGGIFAARIPAPLPEIIFGIPFGAALYFAFPHGWHIFGAFIPGWAIFIAGWLSSYLCMELGHGNAFHDGVAQYDFPDRHQGLDFAVRPVCRAFIWAGGSAVDFAPRGMWYCRLFMGLKGLLIGAPLLAYAPLLAVLWAMGYSWCFRSQIEITPMQRSSASAEWFTGMFAAMVIAASPGGQAAISCAGAYFHMGFLYAFHWLLALL